MPAERLSSQDATVWCVQASNAPLLLGGLALCDAAALRDDSGALRIDAIRRHFEARLAAAPRFRKTLRHLPMGQGLVWVDDEHFDIARHMRLTSLPRPGNDDQLRELVARVLEAPLPADRPLWEFWVVDGVSGDRVALVPKFSHVLGDGMAILGLVMSLFDGEPRSHDDEPPDWSPVPGPGMLSLVATAVVGRWRGRVGTLLSLGGTLVSPSQLLTHALGLLDASASILRAAPTLPFTRPVGPRRDFAWVRLPLRDLETVKRMEAVKLNDVVLAVIAAAVSRYVGQCGTLVERVRGVVPVSLHGAEPAGEMGNRFSMVFVDLPCSAEPLEQLRQVHAETARRKQSLQTTIGTVVLTLGGVVPQQLLRRVGPAVLRHQPFVNMVVTNLVGSRRPLYLLGAQVLEMYPYVTVTGNLGITIGVVSYADGLGVGITVDADAVPDVDALAVAVKECAGELVRAAGAAGG